MNNLHLCLRCWNCKRLKAERFKRTKFDSINSLELKEVPFYKFKFEKEVLPKQQYSHNCGLGAIMGIIRIAKAFQDNPISPIWVTYA